MPQIISFQIPTFAISVKSLYLEIIKNPAPHKCIAFNEQIRKQINYTENGQQLCHQAIKEVFSLLFADFKPNFEQKQQREVLEEFLTIYEKYIATAKQLNVACYHICYNLRAEKDFNFVQVAEAYIGVNYRNQIEKKLFVCVFDELNEIYRQQGDGSEIRLKRSLKFMIDQEKNQILTSKSIKIFSNFFQELTTFLHQHYELKYKKNKNISSAMRYLDMARAEITLNSDIFFLIKEEGLIASYNQIRRIIYENLLQNYKSELLQKSDGFIALLNNYFQNHKPENDYFLVYLKLGLIIDLYSLFEDQPSYFKELKIEFSLYIRKHINGAFSNSYLIYEMEKQKENRRSIVQRLCEIYETYQNLIQNCFKDKIRQGIIVNYELEMAARYEFENFLKKLDDDIGLTEELCEYINSLIRMVALQQEDRDNLIEGVMIDIREIITALLPSVSDYEYYIMCCKYKLASRLLFYAIFTENPYFMLDLEKQIIQMMGQYCGEKKLKKIFKMIDEIKNQNLSFLIQDMETRIILLQRKKWPKIPSNDSNVFRELTNHKQEAYGYLKQQKDYIIYEFSDTLSFVELYWKEVDKTLFVNCVQAAILFLYDMDDNPLTLDEITDELKLEKSQIKRECDRLVQQKILWQDSETYFLNNSQIELEVSNKQIVMDSAIFENQGELQQYKTIIKKQEDLKQVIEAAMVKLMKKHKTLSFQKLHELVNQQLYPKEILIDQMKPSLEYLLHNDYLERIDLNQLIYKNQPLLTEEILFDEVERLCDTILSNTVTVEIQRLQSINSKINDYIVMQKSDDQQTVAYKFIKLATKKIVHYIDKILAQKFEKSRGPVDEIMEFLTCYKTFLCSTKLIVVAMYSAGTNVDSENVKDFFLSLFDNLFARHLQPIFESILFKSIVEIIKIACQDETKQLKISELLYEFGNIMSKLQSSTDSAQTFRIEQEFKQRIFDYYEERYQQNYKEWTYHHLTPQYLEKVQKEKQTNEKILRFKDVTILEQVNKILNSHLLTQYKSILMSDKNPQNFTKLIMQYHRDKNLQTVIQQIGDLYGCLDDHFDQIATCFKNIVCEEGKEIMYNKNIQIVEANADQNFSDQNFIKLFYDLYDKYFDLIQNCFSKRSDFVMALNNAFETFLNSPIGNHEFADYLVTYIGEQIEVLKTTPKNSSLTMETIVKLFVFINHKERFLKLYKVQLAQRLIKNQRQLDQKKIKPACLVEINAIEEMEKKCGTQDLESLRMMIKDFQAIENTVSKVGTFQIQQPIIINKQFWPEIDELQLNIQSEIIKQQKEIFAEKYAPKILIWLDLVSGVEVAWTDKQITFNISVPQAVLLFLFQFSNEKLSTSAMVQMTGMREAYVAQNCKIMKDFNILADHVENHTTYYTFNENLYKQKKSKKKIIITTDTFLPANQVEQIQSIQDRDLAIEAAIVKIMKKAKEMQFSDLVINVQGHMKQNQNIEVPFSQIKQMIEKLQKNEYLERDYVNMQLIKYK